MIPTTIDRIAAITGGKILNLDGDAIVGKIVIDSKGATPNSLFVALPGRNADGHQFLDEAFRNGAVAALVAESKIADLTVNEHLLGVPSPLIALQALARWHRKEAIDRVVAVTGSNGKTIVKDALAAMLGGRDVFRSPGSYNSQIGVPLSLLSVERRTELGVFEAGISEPGEMSTLGSILSPDYGILTNIGMAHFASFGSQAAIATEKMKLFENIPSDGWVLLPANEPTIKEATAKLNCKVVYPGDLLDLTTSSFAMDGCKVSLSDSTRIVSAKIKTRAPYVIADLRIAASAAYLLGVNLDEIAESIEDYTPNPTRMEMWSSPDGVWIINDAHSSDPISARAAIEVAASGATEGGRKFFVFAGMRELGDREKAEHRQIGVYAGEREFDHLFLVGNSFLQSTAEGYKSARHGGHATTVADYPELKSQLVPMLRRGDVVLFKGPRNSSMAQTAREIAGSLAQRTLWVDLASIRDNVLRFRRHCGGKVRVMAMLKALAYGTDIARHAYWLSSLGINQVGVSSTNEGVAVRKTGAGQDIFVFLPDSDDVATLAANRLTPILYSAELVNAFAVALSGSRHRLDVHLKIDTGMHRLGVDPREVVALAQKIARTGSMRLTGVCTHFAAAEDPQHDEKTRSQIAVFNACLARLRMAGFDNLCAHAANTAAAIRFPEARYDMIRVGLGLYGIHSSPATQDRLDLALAIGVTSKVASVQQRQPGESIGYGFTFTPTQPITVATVPFGYNDGIPWRAGDKGHVLVDGHSAPIIGRVSMDQMQIDVSNVEGVVPGTEVLIYGEHNGHVLRPELVADEAHTIPHELLIRLGRRVHRIYSGAD